LLSGCRWGELRRSETPPAGVASRAGNKYLRGQCVKDQGSWLCFSVRLEYEVGSGQRRLRWKVMMVVRNMSAKNKTKLRKREWNRETLDRILCILRKVKYLSCVRQVLTRCMVIMHLLNNTSFETVVFKCIGT